MKKIWCLLSLLFLSLGMSSWVYAQNETPEQNFIEKIGGAINNASITAVITGKYAIDPLLDPFTIEVSTENGVVTLRGNVDSTIQYNRAVALAKETDNVQRVNASALTITSSQSPMSDAFTTFKIKMLLFKNSLFDGQNYSAWNIQVETNNGVVYMVGQVNSEQAKDQLLSMTHAEMGANKVIADIRVNK